MTKFDVLIVYTDGIATSASSNKNINLPFSKASKRTNYNNAYAYFLQICKKNNINAAFTTTQDMDSDGIFKSYWRYEKNKWIKVVEECRSDFIFDKFSPINKKQKARRKLLFSDDSIIPFNHPQTFKLFFDKQKTFNNLFTFALPTVSIENIEESNVKAAYKNLSKIMDEHPFRADFSKDIVLKDRFGGGGNNIHKIGKKNIVPDILQILSQNKKTSFVIQPFAHFNDGHGTGKFKGYVDIRIIFLGHQIIQSYIRKPKKDDFRCNEHQGGSLEYISTREIPKKVMNVAMQIPKLLHKDTSLYALDFLISNSGKVFLMEGNSGPGIDWNLSLKRNERNGKKLIREIVKTIKSRISTTETQLEMPLGAQIPQQIIPLPII